MANCDKTLNDYKLSCELYGHSADVRVVTHGNNDTIISGSRDKTVKIWQKEGKEYVEKMTLSNHTHFISSLLYLDDVNWICTGSNDSTIQVYKADSMLPFATLKGHKDTVCALAKGLKSQIIISGSWDKTSKIWLINESGETKSITLEGHEAAVWAVVTLSIGQYVTGSADKKIIYWNDQGKQIRVLNGHKDCVRSLIALENGELLSCGNDAVIKHWNVSGECINEFYGHSNFVYTMALNEKLGNDTFVSGGEDCTIRMWKFGKGETGDPIYLPAQSVWSITCLKNGDIVTGTSDGIVRVFTTDQDRFASEEKLREFNLASQTRKLQENEEIGGIKRNDLPGPESLLEPGRDGQTKMVRQPNGKILCYQWSDNNWKLLGDVMGASGGTNYSQKSLFEGKEYDYVFNVDISDDSPPLKLPYNRGEDPWVKAQEFIHKNNLSQLYLDQIANFIIKNADARNIQSTNNSGGFEDPFTGGSRYIPGSNSNQLNAFGNVDPFTGSSSYSTGNKLNFQQKDDIFPYNQYTTFDNCALSKVIEKLKDFNKTAAQNNLNVDEQSISSLVTLAQDSNEIEQNTIETFTNMLKWPKEILFPVLDIARLAIRNEKICKILIDKNCISVILENLSNLPANQLMSIRCLVNMMKHSLGKNFIKDKIILIFSNVKYIENPNVSLQAALSSLYLNFTILQNENPDENQCQAIAEGIIEFLKKCNIIDNESYYRCMLALGNLLYTPFFEVIKMQIISAESFYKKLKEYSESMDTTVSEKSLECARQLIKKLI